MVVITPPLIAVEPPAFVMRLARAVPPPTAPANWVIPVVFAVRASPPRADPSTVPENVMLPVPVEMIASPASVVAPATLKALLDVV